MRPIAAALAVVLACGVASADDAAAPPSPIGKLEIHLYDESADIDAARVPILMPQGVDPVRNREALPAHRGFAIAYVLAHPGAVGSIPHGADPGRAKVIPVN